MRLSIAFEQLFNNTPNVTLNYITTGCDRLGIFYNVYTTHDKKLCCDMHFEDNSLLHLEFDDDEAICVNSPY